MNTLITMLCSQCQAAVANILKDKVLVGHALKNDLDVLMLSHPRTMIRDTATYRPYMRVRADGQYVEAIRIIIWSLFLIFV